MSFWRLNGGDKIIILGGEYPIWCDDCPCDTLVVPACNEDFKIANPDLLATFSDRTTTCATPDCMPDTLILEGPDPWTSSSFNCSDCVGGAVDISIDCVDGEFEFTSIALGAAITSATLVSFSSVPFELVYDVVCSDGGTFTMTITEMP